MPPATDHHPDEAALAARIVPKGINGTVRLAVDFDGAQPPTEFFADLEMIGWQVAASPPPPREAIDWTTPDPETGQRFSVSSWQVVGHVVDPPRGSARGGAWAPEETRPFMAALNGVLRRHGLDGDRPTQAATKPPPPSVRVETPAQPILAAVQGQDTADRPASLVTLLVDPPLRARVEEQLDETPSLHVAWSDAQRKVKGTFRGSTHERIAPTLRLQVWLSPDDVRTVSPILARAAAIEMDDAERFQVEVAAPTPTLSAVPQPDAKPDGAAVITLLVDPPLRPRVEEQLGGLPALQVEWADAQRKVKGTFRGSTHERIAWTLRLQVWLSPDDVRTVSPILARAAGIQLDDAERFQIEVPSRLDSLRGQGAAAAPDASDTTEGLRTA